MNGVTLPRTAVLKLLHLAQAGDGAGFITREPDGDLSIRPIRTEMDTRAGRDEAVFAFYRTATQAAPSEEDIERWSGVTQLFLSVSVGIKGVLQLRGWLVSGTTPSAIELSLAEEDGNQNRVVSRNA